MNPWQNSYTSLYCQISGRVEFPSQSGGVGGKRPPQLWGLLGSAEFCHQCFRMYCPVPWHQSPNRKPYTGLAALSGSRERVNSAAVQRQQDLFVLVSHNIWWRDWKTAEQFNSGLFTWWVTLRESSKLALVPRVKCEIHRAEYSSTAAPLTWPDSVMLIWVHWCLFETKAFMLLWSYIICQSICPD